VREERKTVVASLVRRRARRKTSEAGLRVGEQLHRRNGQRVARKVLKEGENREA